MRFHCINSIRLISCLFIFIKLQLAFARPLISGNYKDFCDETYRENSSIVLRGHQLLIPSISSSSSSNHSSNQTPVVKYLHVKNVNNFNDCVKQCCIDEFKCDVAFFNHSSNACLHIICNLDGSQPESTAQCPPTRKANNQTTSILKIRTPSLRTSPIKYHDELSREQLINQFGLVDGESNLVLKSKNFDTLFISADTGPQLSNLTVVVNKNPIIQLPNNSITISAYVFPISNKYIYKWTLVSRPSQNNQDSGSWEEQNTDSLKLNKLIEGTYIFNVTVTLPNNPNAIGQESVNITVLPPKRINRPPQAIIQPSNSTVQLPKTEIVLDGSQSTDDDKIISYKWNLIKTPIGFELPSNDLETQTLQLKNLVAGDYIFKLTIMDSNGQTSTAQATLTVLREKDYPPTAIVSQDQIIFLPQNSVTLMGNQSTDDKKIVSYEWKLVDENGANKQINNMDMSGVKTPFLHLSNLELGVYKAVLKVTDSSNQTSTAETHVFVKPEVDIKPEANIRLDDQKVYMPLKENVVLDGSNSKDVTKAGIISWKWSQLDGPRQSVIENPNDSITNVTGLIPGRFVFLLEITNSKNLSSNATATVEVFPPNENDKPIADAGGNQTIVLPRDIVILNGSKSHDDLIDLKYIWTREPNSLAIGDVVDQSDRSAILKLTNLIHGRYIFKLTVIDNQGEKASDLAIIDVMDPDNIEDTVEVLLKANYKKFRYEQEHALLKKFEILLSSNIDEIVKLKQVQLYPVYDSQLTLLRFNVHIVVNKAVVALSATEVVKRLRLRLRHDKSLIDPEILYIKTVMCQNSCSGHGKCMEKTKECRCNTFWMQNFLRFHFGDGLENCDWSVLYFIIFSTFAFIFVCTVLWSFLCFFVRRRTHLNFNKIKPRLRLKKTRKPRASKYTLLKQQNGFGNKADDQTDDSDSELEHRTKLKKCNNGSIETKIKIKNGNSKSNYKSSSESETIEYDFSNLSRRGYS